MAGPDVPHFHFLPTVTSSTRTRRDIELSRSSARSHLAKISHRQHRLGGKASISKSGSNTNTTRQAPTLETQAASTRDASLYFTRLNDYGHRTGVAEQNGASRAILLAEADDLETDLFLDQWPADNAFVPNAISGGRALQEQHEQMITATTRGSSLLPTVSTYRPNAWTTVSHHLSSLHSLRLFEYCGTRLWKGYNPGMGVGDQYAPLYAVAWAASQAGSCAYFSAQMWQAAIHMSLQRGEPITEPESFRYYQRALRMISEDLQKPISTIDHSTIFAILGLCLPEQKSFRRYDQFNDGFRSPFLNLQWIGLLGREPMVKHHLHALFRIVELKGGIDMLHIFPSTYAVQYLDVLDSTFHLCPPRFHLAHMFQTNGSDCHRDNHFGLKKFLYVTGDMFDIHETETPAIQDLLHHGLSAEVHEVMLDMRVWALLLPKLQAEYNVRIGGSMLALRRNIIQHRLLCTINTEAELLLRSSTQSKAVPIYQRSSTVTKLVRTGLLVFSVGVMFPVQYASVYATLLEQLRNLLTKHLSTLLDRELYNLITWLCILGCLATSRAPTHGSRGFFIDTMCQAEELRASTFSSKAAELYMENGISGVGYTNPPSWDFVKKSCLTPFVWNDEACDSGAQLIWFEVQWQLNNRSLGDNVLVS